MSLRWQLSHGPGTQKDVSARVRANTTSVRTNAEEGSVGMSQVLVDDPAGDLEIGGLGGFYGFETEAPSAATCFYRGFIADRDISRGEDTSSFRTGAARRYAVNVADQNTLLSRRVMLGSDCNRPAETDVARVQWLLTTAEMGHLDDTTYVNTSGPIAMDAADYRGQYAFDILNDCAQASGKNFWVPFVEDSTGGGTFGLWYDFTSSSAYPSNIQISNVNDDIDGVTTFAASFDSKLNRDPHRVYSGVYMPYDGGAVFQQLSSTGSNFQFRDTTSYSPNVKTAAKATARALRYLNTIATEEDRITTTIIVPNAQVNDLKEGHLVTVRFSHFPGYESPTPVRVLNRTVTQVSEYFYSITVECSADPGESPAAGVDQFTTATALGTTLNVTWPDGEVAANALLLGFLALRANPDADLSDTVPISYVSTDPSAAVVAGTGWTWQATAYARSGNEYGMVMASRIATVPDTLYPRWTAMGGSARPRAHHIAISGLSNVVGTPVTATNQSTSGSTFTSPSVTASGAGYIFAGFSYSAAGPGDGFSSPFVMTPTSADTTTLTSGYGVGSFAPYSWFGYRQVTAAGSYTVTLSRSAVPRGNTNGYGWICAFVAGTATAQPTTGSGSGAGPVAGGGTYPSPPPAGAPAGTLQAAIDATATSGTLDLGGLTYTGPATVDRAMTITNGTVTHPSGTKGIIIGANNVTLSTVTVTGPQYAAFNGNEYGIYSDGHSGLTLTNCVVNNEGNTCVFVKGSTSGLAILGGHYYNAVYGGLMIWETTGGSVHADLIENIGVFDSAANSHNAYGVALSNFGGTQTNGVTVGGQSGRRMVVRNVPQWHGLDTHAGINNTFSYIDVYQCNRAIFLTQDSTGRVSTGSVVNNCTASQPTHRDETTVYPWNQVGLTVVTGCSASGTVLAFDGWPTGNHIDVQAGASGTFTSVTVTNPY